jgi:hypothetical protein
VGWINSGFCITPYLAQRGVDSKTAAHFGIGFYPGKGLMEGRIVIPIHNEEGILVAYAGRNLDQSEPRYRFPGRFCKSLVCSICTALFMARPSS